MNISRGPFTKRVLAALDSGNFTYSEHFMARMEERGFKVDDITQALKFGLVMSTASEYNGTGYTLMSTFITMQLVELADGKIVFVTVHPTSDEAYAKAVGKMASYNKAKMKPKHQKKDMTWGRSKPKKKRPRVLFEPDEDSDDES